MGIKNLKKIIQKHAPDAISDKPDLYNKKICIDSSILLYRFRYTYKEDNFHIQGFLYSIIDYLEKGVIPIFVFDGAPPDAKKNTLEKRTETRNKMKDRVNELIEQRNKLNVEMETDIETVIYSDDEDPDDSQQVKEIKKINSSIRNIEKNILVVKKFHSDQVMEFLDSLGLPYIKAYSESEETCAFLQRNGYTDYVVTEDTDALTFGATKVIFGQKLYSLDKVLKGIDINFDQFIDLCILCGCDYTGTIPKVGPVNALKMIKKFGSIDFFENVPETFEYQMARDLFKQNENYTYPSLNFDFKPMDHKKCKEMFERYSLNNYFYEKLIILLK